MGLIGGWTVSFEDGCYFILLWFEAFHTLMRYLSAPSSKQV